MSFVQITLLDALNISHQRSMASLSSLKHHCVCVPRWHESAAHVKWPLPGRSPIPELNRESLNYQQGGFDASSDFAEAGTRMSICQPEIGMSGLFRGDTARVVLRGEGGMLVILLIEWTSGYGRDASAPRLCTYAETSIACIPCLYELATHEFEVSP